MGMYDWVECFIECPNCDHYINEWQTKDLGRNLYRYSALSEIDEEEMELREDIPVIKQFPKDKENEVWDSQAERMRAAATIPDVSNVDHINIIGTCSNCEKTVYSKLPVEDNKIRGDPEYVRLRRGDKEDTITR